jgi:hypothetical protein
MNKLSTLFATILFLTGILTGCNKEQNPVAGSNSHKVLDAPAIDVVVEEMPLGGYTDIVNNTNFDVVVVEDVNYNVIVEAVDYATLATIEPTVSNGTLTISAPASTTTTEATVYVHTPVAGKIDIKKDGNVRVNGNYSTLDVNLKGNGSGIISGTANLLRISGNGNGNLDALSMPAIDVVVNIKGNSQVKVAPQSTLDVDLGGNSKVFYTGNPIVTKKLKGNAKLKKI